ncbi:FAD-binding oxidoreductase [Pleomorphomonas sp. JP5]|uniref:NAD(P)/FAD-dependent oxidoreductase n=1 Tax=Pleomorphomonas sp. JP5 TaxID=2942998 RepID=UPI002043470D|nr:FAD-binding oxidoreductase [Pleomorphomonas sp. JP5]MCM5556046.1 FAD-binding oxidoreductase [Pleomorphomonas sp. JP5]
MPQYDVVIVGGAVTGSSAAYHLAANPDFSGKVLVLEKDPSYRKCASALSAASIRQQFSTAVNIKISLYGLEFIRNIGDLLEVDGDRPDIGFHEDGYLFLATDAGRDTLAENHKLQVELGADIAFLEPETLSTAFPWLSVDDLSAGCYGRSGEGWFDGYGMMQAFRRKARSLGVEYRPARAAAVEVTNGKAVGVRLEDGELISAGTVINASGADGRKLAATAGIDIPIEVKKRMIFTFKAEDRIERCPLLIDPNGTYVRGDSDGFICGWAPSAEDDPEVEDDFDVDWNLFEDHIWPTIATRVPAFERIKPGAAWAGYYDMCAHDDNVLLGAMPELPNFLLANGFSGHGLQQAPAVGRGLGELVVYGGYRSLDLSELSPTRVRDGRQVREKNIV